MNLAQDILGISFQNPFVTASGKWGWESSDTIAAANAGVGGVTTKSFWSHEHQGNAEPVFYGTEHWSLNAVGLADLGRDHSDQQIADYLSSGTGVPLIVSILGMTADEYAENAAHMASLNPAALEVNISSPTFLKLKGGYFDPDEVVEVIPAVKQAAGSVPVFVKLTPNIADIGGFAARCVEAGADGITAINTVGPGMSIDVETRQPVISAGRGGVSGPGIKPIAVRCVADIYEATEGCVPIIGTGGVSSGADAVEMMMAGASLVGVGTAVLREGFDVFTRFVPEMEQWCESHGVGDVSELVGTLNR